jgi:hypothetical protein
LVFRNPLSIASVVLGLKGVRVRVCSGIVTDDYGIGLKYSRLFPTRLSRPETSPLSALFSNLEGDPLELLSSRLKDPYDSPPN